MKKQIKRALYLTKETIEVLQADLDEVSSGIDLSDRSNRDKLVWAKAKVNDLLRLLNSIK